MIILKEGIFLPAKYVFERKWHSEQKKSYLSVHNHFILSLE